MLIQSLIIFLFSTFSLYPIDYLFLNNLCDLSTHIAEVEILHDTFYTQEDRYIGVATLQIIRGVKGEFPNERVQVNYDPGLICPEGPTFLINKKALAFMKKGDEKYRITGYSYGMKYLEDSQVRNEYISRISSYLEIRNKEPLDSLRVVDWLIENLEYKTVRHESLLIINKSLYNQRYLGQGISRKSMIYKKNAFPITTLWTTDHKSIILNEIMSGEIDDRYCSGILVSHLYDPKNKEFEKLLVSKIPHYAEKNSYRWIAEVIETIQTSDEALMAIKDELGSFKPYHKHSEVLVELGLKFYNKYVE